MHPHYLSYSLKGIGNWETQRSLKLVLKMTLVVVMVEVGEEAWVEQVGAGQQGVEEEGQHLSWVVGAALGQLKY